MHTHVAMLRGVPSGGAETPHPHPHRITDVPHPLGVVEGGAAASSVAVCLLRRWVCGHDSTPECPWCVHEACAPPHPPASPPPLPRGCALPSHWRGSCSGAGLMCQLPYTPPLPAQAGRIAPHARGSPSHRPALHGNAPLMHMTRCTPLHACDVGQACRVHTRGGWVGVRARCAGSWHAPHAHACRLEAVWHAVLGTPPSPTRGHLIVPHKKKR